MDMRIVGVGLVVGLVLGVGGAYMLNSQQLQELKEEIDYLEIPDRIVELQIELDNCMSEYEALETEYETVQGEYYLEQGSIIQLTLLQSGYNQLSNEYDELQNSFAVLQTTSNTLLLNYQELQEKCLRLDELREINETYHDLLVDRDIIEAEPITEILYSMQAGEMKVFTFSLPYGILIEEEMSYSGNYLANMVSWKKDGMAGIITGGGQATAEGYPTLDLEIRLTYYIEGGALIAQLNWTSNYSYLHSEASVRVGIP